MQSCFLQAEQTQFSHTLLIFHVLQSSDQWPFPRFTLICPRPPKLRRPKLDTALQMNSLQMLGIITSLDLLPYFFITKNVAGLLVIGADCWLTFNFISAQTRSSFLQNQAVLVPGSSSSRQFYSLEVIMQVILTLGYVFAFFNVEHYSTPQTISTICTRLF